MDWLAEHHVEGSLAFRIGRHQDGRLVAEWIGIGRLEARPDGSGVSFAEAEGADPAELAKVRNASVPMLLRHLSGHLTLHASSVTVDDAAVILIGDSGAGKSTLAAWLVEYAGASLLSDDLTPLEPSPWRAAPLESAHLLTPDAFRRLGYDAIASVDGNKRTRVPTRRASSACPVALIVELAFESGAAVSISPIGGVSAVRAVLNQVVRFVIDDPGRQQREMEDLASLLEQVPVYRLVRGTDEASLDASGERIATLVRATKLETSR